MPERGDNKQQPERPPPSAGEEIPVRCEQARLDRRRLWHRRLTSRGRACEALCYLWRLLPSRPSPRRLAGDLELGSALAESAARGRERIS